VENIGEIDFKNVEFQNKYCQEKFLQKLTGNLRTVIYIISNDQDENLNNKLISDICYSFKCAPDFLDICSNSNIDLKSP
jgi:hypothetical protein